MKSIVVKKSKISGKGVFAGRGFKEGEVVLKWRPMMLTKSQAEALSERDRHYLNKTGNKYLLMGSPERYMNHSCAPNTRAKRNGDVAIRDIRKGEEITSDYYGEGEFKSFQCRCAHKSCQGFIGTL